MSILIRGMEMPKDGCMDCPVHKWTFAGEMCCITDEIVGGNVERGGFPPNCPLISVSEHGRLIDADEFFTSISMDDRTTIVEAMHINELLVDAPTIIPADKEVDK